MPTIQSLPTVPHMIQALIVLQDSRDVDDFENSFIKAISSQTDCGYKVASLSELQIDAINRLYTKNFTRNI